ncbi:prepilin-type N-terminal cleavage/methylation domain-containing protein [bacterium]|nr:prepilin-type N-terminal cleavage/methylation domain-containing protein [bacterium]
MKKALRSKKGFTLIELMVVVIIVGILAAVSVPLYRAQVRKAIASEGAALVGSIRSAQRVYYSEENEYYIPGEDDNIADALNIETTDSKYFLLEDVEITNNGGAGFLATAKGAEGSTAENIEVSIDQEGTIKYYGLQPTQPDGD